MKCTMHLRKDRSCEKWQRVIEAKWFFIYWFRVRCVYKKKGGPHNEHSKYSMPTGCRFHPEKSFLADVFSPFWAYVKLWPLTNWRSLVITRFHSLTALDQCPSSYTALSGFQSRYSFRGLAALSGFQLDLIFTFFFFFSFSIFLVV